MLILFHLRLFHEGNKLLLMLFWNYHPRSLLLFGLVLSHGRVYVRYFMRDFLLPCLDLLKRDLFFWLVIVPCLLRLFLILFMNQPDLLKIIYLSQLENSLNLAGLVSTKISYAIQMITHSYSSYRLLYFSVLDVSIYTIKLYPKYTLKLNARHKAQYFYFP